MYLERRLSADLKKARFGRGPFSASSFPDAETQRTQSTESQRSFQMNPLREECFQTFLLTFDHGKRWTFDFIDAGNIESFGISLIDKISDEVFDALVAVMRGVLSNYQTTAR